MIRHLEAHDTHSEATEEESEARFGARGMKAMTIPIRIDHDEPRAPNPDHNKILL